MNPAPVEELRVRNTQIADEHGPKAVTSCDDWAVKVWLSLDPLEIIMMQKGRGSA